MGYSRDSFYRLKQLYDTRGESALHEISRKKSILKNRVDPELEEAVVKMAFDYPAFAQQRACNELRKQGVFISAAGIRCVWQRHGLEIFQKRLKGIRGPYGARKSDSHRSPADGPGAQKRRRRRRAWRN